MAYKVKTAQGALELQKILNENSNRSLVGYSIHPYTNTHFLIFKDNIEYD